MTKGLISHVKNLELNPKFNWKLLVDVDQICILEVSLATGWMMEGRRPRLEAEVEGGVRAVTGWSEGKTRGQRPVRKSCKGRGCWQIV